MRFSEAEEGKFIENILSQFGESVKNEVKFEILDCPIKSEEKSTLDEVKKSCSAIEAKANGLNEGLLQLKMFMKSLEKKLASLV